MEGPAIKARSRLCPRARNGTGIMAKAHFQLVRLGGATVVGVRTAIKERTGPWSQEPRDAGCSCGYGQCPQQIR